MVLLHMSLVVAHLSAWISLQGARLDTQRALADERVAKEMVQERCASIQQVRFVLQGFCRAPDEPQLTLAATSQPVSQSASVRAGSGM